MTGKEKQVLEAEAALFGLYLLGTAVDAKAKGLYVTAMAAKPGSLSRQDQSVMRYLSNHPWSLGLLDAGLALLYPNAELRRRLFVMFSILETNPEYAEAFLPKHHGVLHLFEVFYNGIKGICKVVIGAVLVKVVIR